MEANNTKRKTVARILRVISLVLFAISALIFVWAIFLLAEGNAPHDPTDLNGLLGLFGLIMLVVATIPSGLGGIIWVIAYKMGKSQNTSQSPQITSTEDQNSEVIHPQTPSI